MKKTEEFNGALIATFLLLISSLLLWSFINQRNSRKENTKETQAEQVQQSTKGNVNKELKEKQVVVSSSKPVARPRIVRKRLEAEATRRLATEPQRIRTVLTTTGRAENANWGIKGMASFVLTYYVDCKAEILEKKENAVGEIKVVEKRTYTRSEQRLELSETDVGLSLYDTLPLDRLFTVVDIVGEGMIYSGEPETAALGEVVKVAGASVNTALKNVDGKSVRGVFEMFGINMSEKIERMIKDFVEKRVESLFRPSVLKGKSYLITYIQDKESGAPLRVDFTNADGSAIKTEEEWLVLRRANAFMDSNMIPNRSCSPGDSWTIDSSEFDCLLDPFVDGSYSGKVVVERKDDDKSGNWILAVQPSNVSIVTDEGKTNGELRIEKGDAQVDGINAYVKAMVVTGKGNMKNLTKHHMLFKSRFEGECSFRGSMVTEPIAK